MEVWGPSTLCVFQLEKVCHLNSASFQPASFWATNGLLKNSVNQPSINGITPLHWFYIIISKWYIFISILNFKKRKGAAATVPMPRSGSRSAQTPSWPCTWACKLNTPTWLCMRQGVKAIAIAPIQGHTPSRSPSPLVYSLTHDQTHFGRKGSQATRPKPALHSTVSRLPLGMEMRRIWTLREPGRKGKKAFFSLHPFISFEFCSEFNVFLFLKEIRIFFHPAEEAYNKDSGAIYIRNFNSPQQQFIGHFWYRRKARQGHKCNETQLPVPQRAT